MTTERDYGTLTRCTRCGYRAPFYLFLPAIKYPGTVRCPECSSDKTEAAVEQEATPKPSGDGQQVP